MCFGTDDFPTEILNYTFKRTDSVDHLDNNSNKGSGDLMDKVSATQPWDRKFEPHTSHDHDSSYDTSTGWFQEANSRVI